MMSRLLMVTTILVFSISCDQERHRKCEWYLVPEPDHRDLVEKGWVSLCARNYVNNRQRCFLQSKLGFAEKIYGQAFRFSTLELDKSYPRKVLSLKTCVPEKKKPR